MTEVGEVTLSLKFETQANAGDPKDWGGVCLQGHPFWPGGIRTDGYRDSDSMTHTGISLEDRRINVYSQKGIEQW